MRVLMLLLVVVTTVWSAGFTRISGDLPPKLTASRSPYLVESDVYVPSGRVTFIEAGCVFLFRNFTGLKVQGVLNAQGTADAPVVFTSEMDTAYNRQSGVLPNAYDWNGIFVDKDGLGTDLKNVKIQYTVFGLTSLTRFIRLENALFAANGRGNFMVEGSAKEVGELPFSYSVSVKDAMVDGVPVKILADPLAAKRTVYRFGGAGLFVAGAVLGGVFTAQTMDAQKRLDYLSNNQDKSMLVDNDSHVWVDARNTRNVDIAVMCLGYLAAIAGAAGFGLSFTF